MPLSLAAAVSVQQDLAGNTTAVLTWGSTAYAAGELLIIDAMGNWDSGTISLTQQVVPSGGGTWTPAVRQLSAGPVGGTASSAWYYIVPAGGQTFTITQSTTINSGGSNMSSRGVLRRWLGGNLLVPIGATDGYVSATVDPLTSAASLELANVRAGSIISAAGCDWTDSVTVACTFDNSIADTEDINARETGQVHFCAIRSTNPLPTALATIRAGFDKTSPAGAGDWSAIIYEIREAEFPTFRNVTVQPSVATHQSYNW